MTQTITFLNSTTTVTTDRDADGQTDTSVRHHAWFVIEVGPTPGVLPDMQAKYGKWRFRPAWVEAEYLDGRLYAVTVSGPRVLKGGLSERDRGKFWWSGQYRPGSAVPEFDRDDLPAPIAERLAEYETAIAGQSQGASSL